MIQVQAKVILMPDTKTKTKTKKKHYVVWTGKDTGIFDSWSDVQPLVIGHAGAKFKGFDTRSEAEAAFASPPEASIVRKSGARSKARPRPAFTLDPDFNVHIFSDGACIPNPGVAGSGVAVYRGGELAECWYGGYEPMGTNNTAELYALHQALLIAERKLNSDAGDKVQILSDSSYSLKAMNEWAARWKRNGWRRRDGEEVANQALIATMFEQFSAIRDGVTLVHVKGHAGIEGNELADRLSFLARLDKVQGFEPFDRLDKTALLAVQVSASAE